MFCFFRARFHFSNILYTSGIEMSQHFQGLFVGPHQLLRAIGPRTPDRPLVSSCYSKLFNQPE